MKFLRLLALFLCVGGTAYAQVNNLGPGSLTGAGTVAAVWSAASRSTGSANAQIVTSNTGNFTLQAGNAITFIPGFTNNAATTLNVDGQGAIAVHANGSPLTAGALVVGISTTLVYNGTSFDLVTASTPASIGGLAAANNLSDVASEQTSFGNLTQTAGIFYVGWYGALGVSPDDCPAIQNAFNAAATWGAAHGTGTVVFDSRTYNCLTSLSYDPAVVNVRGNGAAINASSMTASPVMNVVQTHTGIPPSGSTYEQTYSHSFENMFFYGPGSGSTVDLFFFQSADGTPQPNSRSIFKNISSYSFRYNYVFGNHAYLVKVENFNIGYSARGIYAIRGSTDAGEQIAFSHGVIDHTTSGVYDDGTFAFYMNDVSFDFDTQWIYTAYGVVTCDPCHAEDVASGFTQPKLFADGYTGSTIYWHGGDINVDGSGPVTTTSAYVTMNPPGQIIFDGAFLNNMAIGSTAFSSGAGVLSISNTKTMQFAQGFFVTRDSTNVFSQGNLLADGGFENSSIQDLVWIGADTANIVYRTSGTNVSAALSTDTSMGGTQSLKITKANNAGAATVYIAAPFSKQQLPLTQSNFAVLGSQTGSIVFTLQYIQILGYDGTGIPIIGKTQTVGSLTATKTLTGSPISWTSTSTNADGDSPTRAPLWATHIALKCDAASMNAGSFYIDNVIFNSM